MVLTANRAATSETAYSHGTLEIRPDPANISNCTAVPVARPTASVTGPIRR